MNAYEQKQSDRRDRMAERAEKLRAQANADFRKADLREEYSGIPMGQPILVGHHSEKRHRKAIERADNAMRRAIETSNKAAELEARAASPSTAISSDDPDADDKLAAKIARAENEQTFMRAANKVIRKASKGFLANGFETSGAAWLAYLEALRAIPEGERISDQAAATLLRPDFCGRIGFADYQLSNNNANIRRMKLRLAQIESRQAKAEAVAAENDGEAVTEKVVNGVRVVDNYDDNRLQLIFPGKPDSDARATLKRFGFRWSPTAGAWQRQLNNGARWAAESVLKAIA